MRFRLRTSYVLMYTVVGAAVGYLLVHPVSMVIYAYEAGTLAVSDEGLFAAVLGQMVKSFLPAMLPMGLYFSVLGAALGLGAGLLSRAIARRDRVLVHQERQLHESVGALIHSGESHGLEFKSSLRWDTKLGGVNKDLERVVVNTVAGFMNANGGTLLIGVDDTGAVLGLSRDYASLRKKDRDGFEQRVLAVIASHLGTDACAMVHVLFHRVGDQDICRVSVESSLRPVYVRHKENAQFFLRTGNATRQLDVQESMRHITSHWKDPAA